MSDGVNSKIDGKNQENDGNLRIDWLEGEAFFCKIIDNKNEGKFVELVTDL